MPRWVAAFAPLLFLLIASTTWAQVPGLLLPDDPLEGWRLGQSIQVHREDYRDFRCDPSVAFPGFTFCHKIRFERDRSGSANVIYSFLHTREGTLVYLDRYQRPAVIDAAEAALRIDRISRARAELPRTSTMPQRPGLPDGILAVWGKTELEPFDAARVATIAKGTDKGQAQGTQIGTEFLVDFLVDPARSAREQLPIWRLSGGAGFVWVAALDPRGGFVRATAVDASAIAKSR